MHSLLAFVLNFKNDGFDYFPHLVGGAINVPNDFGFNV